MKLIRLQQCSSTAKIIIMVLYDVIRKKRIQDEHGLNRLFFDLIDTRQKRFSFVLLLLSIINFYARGRK